MNIDFFDISFDLRIPELIALEKMRSKNKTTYFTVDTYILLGKWMQEIHMTGHGTGLIM